MDRKEDINKGAIRYEFENTDVSLKSLAEIHSINYQTLKSWKSREKWSKVATSKEKVATNKEKL